jgi:hypothetical protein
LVLGLYASQDSNEELFAWKAGALSNEAARRRLYFTTVSELLWLFRFRGRVPAPWRRGDMGIVPSGYSNSGIAIALKVERSPGFRPLRRTPSSHRSEQRSLAGDPEKPCPFKTLLMQPMPGLSHADGTRGRLRINLRALCLLEPLPQALRQDLNVGFV